MLVGMWRGRGRAPVLRLAIVMFGIMIVGLVLTLGGCKATATPSPAPSGGTDEPAPPGYQRRVVTPDGSLGDAPAPTTPAVS